MISLKFLLAIVVCLELASSYHGTHASEVIGCGGFIKSNTDINYKIIKVKLLTKDGRIVKYTTEASPVNGYYMIPVYAKGEYILQVNPPPGWSFEPNEIEINVDGEMDMCTLNQDINFFFKGFGLSGKVVTKGDPRMNGPAGVRLSLISEGKLIDSSLSGSDGTYYFSDVMPGAYQITAAHDSVKFLNDKVSVVLSKENWSAKENIIVSGYNVMGSVATSSGEAIPNIKVDLLSSEDLNAKAIASIKTDSAGKFTFKDVAYGKYRLLTDVDSSVAGIKFHMKPDNMMVDVTNHRDVLIAEQFKLDRISVDSQALLKKDGPSIESGEASVNNQKIPITNKGHFTYTLKSGNHKITLITTQGSYFTPTQFNLDLSKAAILDFKSPQFKNLATLTHFIASSFDVCGQVTVNKDQNINQLYKSIKINAFLTADTTKKVAVKSSGVDKDLKFCLVLNAGGEYTLKAEVTDSKLAKSLKLVPLEKKIVISDKPVANVNFGQLEARLDGTLVLLPNSNQKRISDLLLTIRSDDSNQAWSKEVPVKCETDLTCKFVLDNLLFGDYAIATNYDDLFCWKGVKKIVIDSERKTFELKQSGFLFNYELSHKNAVLKLNGLERNINVDSDLKGVYCLPEAKEYQMTIESCHRYTDVDGDSDSVVIGQNVYRRGENTMKLMASRVQVDFEVLFRIDDLKQSVGGEDMFVEAKSEEGVVKRIRFKAEKQAANEMVFSGRSWFEPNQKITFTAKSGKILFEQNTKKLKINGENCKANIVKFEAKLGIFIIGSVMPKDLENIEMTLTNVDDDDQNVLEKSLVSKNFKIGPLKSPHTLYNVELVKSGYLFTKKVVSSKNMDTIEYVFTAEKLGELKVSVLDKKLGSKLENVLLSLSSENRQFRQNYKTDSNGETLFSNLKPGLYYLIVMMQEYEFAPNSHPVRISDGQHTDLEIAATRTAYSCLGRVESVNGMPENGVQIEATGIYNTKNADANGCAQSQESATVENGLYRIFNLKPLCEYTLNLKPNVQEKSVLPKIVPNSYTFVLKDEDVVEQNFVVLDPIDKVDFSLGVNFKTLDSPVYNSLFYYVKVKLFKTNKPDQVIQTQYSPANSVVYFNPLPRNPKQQYSIQVSLLATSTNYLFASITQQQQQQLAQQPVVESLEMGFLADSGHKHLQVRFDLDKKTQENFTHSHQQQYQNVYMTLPLFVVIMGILLNSAIVQKKLMSCKNYIEQRGGVTRAFQSTFQSDQMPNTPKSPRRSKNEPKNYHLKKAAQNSNNDSSATESDLERSTKQQYIVRQNVSDSVFNNQEQATNQDYEIINNEDVMDMQLNAGGGGRKQRVKKIE